MSLYLKSPDKAHTKRKGLITLFSFSLLLLLILTACGGPPGNQSTGSTNPGNTSSKPTSLTIVDAPKGDFTSNFNPFLDDQSSRTGTKGFIYETLIYVNRYNNEVTPMLASSYEFPAEANSITFTIRQGVKWSDGKDFTAEDVTFSLEVMKNFPALDRQNLWKDLIQEVATPDASTVKVTFKEPNSTAVWMFGQIYIVAKHLWEGVSDPAKHTNDKPVGTGPYLLKSFAPALIVYTKNPGFWQPGKPEIDELRFPSVKDNATANLMMSKGEIDWAGVGWDPKLDAQFTAKNPDKYHHWFPGTNTVMLYLNLTKAPFNSLEVRQAMSLAINREQLQQKAAPYANPANPSSVLLPAHEAYLAPDYQGAKFAQDLAKANELMQKAGYTKGSDGFYAKDGQKISFKLMVVNGWSDWQSSTQLIANDLKQLGMDVQVDTVADFVPYFPNLQTGNFDAAISWTNQGPTPYYPWRDMLYSANAAPIGQAANGTNWGRWNDEETDKLLQQYRTSADPEIQKQAIFGLQKIIAEQVPAIPLNYNVGWYEYTTVNATGWPSEADPYAYGSPYNFPDNEQIILKLKPVK